LLGNRIGNGKEASGRDQTKVNAPQIWCPVVDLTVVMSESEGAGEERGNKYTGFSSMACTFRAWGACRTRKRKAHVSIGGQRKMRKEGKEEAREERTRGRGKDRNTKETHSSHAYPQPPSPFPFSPSPAKIPPLNRGNSLARECRSVDTLWDGWMRCLMRIL
jgi:hypothetical protein